MSKPALNEPASLFAEVARQRPEWLAQGLFKRAVRTQPRVQKRLLRLLGIDVRPGHHAVLEEQPTECGWRADVTVTGWRKEPVRFELKLLAGLTKRQEEALAKGTIDMIVAPRGHSIRWRQIIDWSSLASWCDDSVLRRLLQQVEDASSWLKENLDPEAAKREFTSLLDNEPDASWRGLYLFLSTIHEHMGSLDDCYRASDAWTLSRRNRYYGYCFWLGRHTLPRFWLGFGEEDKGEIALYLSAKSRSGAREWKVSRGSFRARQSAVAILRKAHAWFRG